MQQDEKAEDRALPGCSIEVRAEVKLPQEQYTLVHFYARALFHEETEERRGSNLTGAPREFFY